jgi:hypothetical protein
VEITIEAQFHGFSTEWLFVPGFALDDDGWQQNSVAMVAKIEELRDVLARSWGLTFAKGIPEGPDIDPKAVVYFSDPPKAWPSLTAKSQSAKQTIITCPVRLGRSER